MRKNKSNGNTRVDSDEDIVVDNYMFKRTQILKYLGVRITNNYDWSAKIASRLLKTEMAFFAMVKYFKSKLFSRCTKICLYITIIILTLTYGCEVWPMTTQNKRKIRSFENKIRKMYSPVLDNTINGWRRRKNAEIREITKIIYITNYVKG